MKFHHVLIGTLSMLSASSLLAGEAVFYLTEDGQAVKNIAVSLDGNKKLVEKSGFVAFDIDAGEHQVELTEFGEYVGEFEFATQSEENAEILVEIVGGEPLPEVNVYSPSDSENVTLGKITGVLTSEETGGGVEGARISVEGTEYAVQTDVDGNYELEIPRGEYSLKIAHPSYGNRDVSGVRVFSNIAINMNMNLSLSGDGVIEELVAVGSYIPSTAVAQQRDASSVLEAIGTEQFSRFGDTNAASALKRVTGVSIEGGKYAVVRGLNPRYTNVLYNKAQLPSPDPSRRVVPLDIFPSNLITSINVRKTGSGDFPADSAGAVIDIISKETPDQFEGKLSVSTTYVDGTTGEDYIVQDTYGSEYFGFGDSIRELPGAAESFTNSGTGSISGTEAGELLELNQFETKEDTLDPNYSIVLSLGGVMSEEDYGTWTYKFSTRYSNEWDSEESERANYRLISASEIGEQDEFIYTRVTNDITLSSGLSFALVGNEYEVYSNTLWLRQTQNDNVSSEGIAGDNRFYTIENEYAWREREFWMQQFLGKYDLDSQFPTTFEGGLTYAEATLDSPDTRKYQFQAGTTIPSDGSFNPTAFSAQRDQADMIGKPLREWTLLEDESTDINFSAETTWISLDNMDFKIKAGFSTLSRERTSETFTYNYDTTGSSLPTDLLDVQDITVILSQDNFDAGEFEINDVTNNEGNYIGEWDLTSFYIQPSYHLFGYYQTELGIRFEDSELLVETLPVTTDGIQSAEVLDDEIYASWNNTVFIGEEIQIRASAYQSVNRPDFREVAPARFTDPESGDLYRGNPNLVKAEVTNLDLRFEYYFSDSESINVGVFFKDFTDAIERTTDVVAGSTTRIFSYENAAEAYAQGLEFSFAKAVDVDSLTFNFSGNLSYFDTEVELENASGFVDEVREMQGQPDVLANAQIALDELESGREYTLIMNYTGESLYAVSATGLNLPNLYQEPRMTVDFNFKQPILQDTLDLKIRLKNLTDSEVEVTQDGELSRLYKPGPEYYLGLDYKF